MNGSKLPVSQLPPPSMLVSEPTRTLFQQDWWLQAASLGRFETVEVKWDAITVGLLSYMPRKLFGIFSDLRMPPFTRTLGPVLNLPPSNPTRHMMNMRRVIGELVAKLPPHDRFHQILDPCDLTPFGFALAGFAVEQNFTFRIPPDIRTESLFAAIDPATRRLIKAGSKKLMIDEHCDLDRFMRVAALDRLANGRRNDFLDFGPVRHLFEACSARGQTMILTAVDQHGADLASVILVWDSRVLYYWLPQRDRAQSGGGANAFLLWKSAKFALRKSLTFDFDGYASLGTARFLSSFGVPHLARPTIMHRSLRGAFWQIARGALESTRVNGIRQDPLATWTSAANMRWRGIIPSSKARASERDGVLP